VSNASPSGSLKRMINHLNSILRQWITAEDLKPPELDCAGCSMAITDPLNGERWRKNKCCTFQPFFPNFYLGAILNDFPRELASAQVYLGPLGMIANEDFRARWLTTVEEFKGENHHCFFYDHHQRKCTVWAFRPGECSTYFCQPVARAAEMSHKTFAVESAVAQMAMIELGYSPDDVSREVETLNSGVGSKDWSYEKVLTVYRRSWEWSQELQPKQIQQWLDFDILGRVAR